MSKVFIETVGCPKNLEDSERMAGLLSAAGHDIAFDPAEADVIVVNTCGFIEDAKRESIETIFEYVPYKEEGKKLIVTGCLSERYPSELAAELPEADAILGVNEYDLLPDIITACAESSRDLLGSLLNKSTRISRPPADGSSLGLSQRGDKPTRDSRLPAAASSIDLSGNLLNKSTRISRPPAAAESSRRSLCELPCEPLIDKNTYLTQSLAEHRQRAEGTRLRTAPRFALTPRHSSYLKIAEGCSNNCAYCVIPSIRGPYRSVPIEQLVRETEGLAAEGCKELVLIAQDVTWYGKDIYGRDALPDLLRAILASEAARDIEWIRLLYCYAERVTDDLIKVMAEDPRVVRYIDLPLQHVSDKILKSMRRVGTGKEIRETIKRLRAAMPDIAIRTTFITGLPGETEEDFEELYNFAEETRFDRLGVFVYSPEEGTDAALMPDQVGRETAIERRDALMRLGQTISLERNQRLVGTIQEVLAEAREEDAWSGRTRADAPEIDDAVIFTAPVSNCDIIGTIVRVRITDAMDYDVTGELVQNESA